MSLNNSDQSDFSNISTYKIRYDNSNNYLYDYSVNTLNSNLLFLNYKIDNSVNLTNIQNELEFDLNDIFNNNEINNYVKFFKDNEFLKKYESNDNLKISSEIFKSKINEITYNNLVKIVSGNEVYDYFSNSYINGNKILLSPLTDNKIVFNLQTYIDISLLNIEESRLNYLKNNIFNKKPTIPYTNYDIDINNLFFKEYIVSFYSDISGELINPTFPERRSVIFYKDTLELTDNLLDSSNTKDIISNVMQDSSDYSNNRIFLVIKDEDLIFNGITQQNIYHNMFIDDENKFIFHKYDTNTKNYVINNINVSVNESSNNYINNKKYLIDLCDNDPYNCFIEASNVYDKVSLKNKLFYDYNTNTNTNDYKTRITYNIIDELENDNNYLSKEYFDIRPLYVNNFQHNNFSNAYNTSPDISHSHSYLINIENYIDRNFYNNSNRNNKVPYNLIDYRKLYYNIIDISYNEFHDEFNIFDIGNKQNIIYKKKYINIIKKIQSEILVVNFKLDYLFSILMIQYDDDDTISKEYNKFNKKINNNNNYEKLVELFENTNFINNNHNLIIPTKSLNELFSYAYYNVNILIQKYNILYNSVDFYNYIIQINVNIYENIRNFNNIKQLENDVKTIDSSIQNILNNIFFFNDETNINTILQYEFLSNNNNFFTNINNVISKFDDIVEI